MRVLIIEPRKCPHVAEIDGSLKSMQEIVGGYIEVICPFADKVAIVCNEEGKLKPDTEWNRLIPECGDIIKGTFFICGDSFGFLPTKPPRFGVWGFCLYCGKLPLCI